MFYETIIIHFHLLDLFLIFSPDLMQYIIPVSFYKSHFYKVVIGCVKGSKYLFVS